MDWKPNKFRMFLLICLLMPLASAADIPWKHHTPEASGFDSSLWQTLRKNRTFEEPADSTVRHKPLANQGQGVRKSPVNTSELWIIPAILIPAILIVVLLKKHKGGRAKSFRDRQTDYEISVSKDGFRQQAEAAFSSGDYRSAFRARYLHLLWLLEQKKLIRYRKDKTNHDYLKELKGNALYVPMQELTIYFDGIWYGMQPLSSPEYRRLSQVLDQMERALSS